MSHISNSLHYLKKKSPAQWQGWHNTSKPILFPSRPCFGIVMEVQKKLVNLFLIERFRSVAELATLLWLQPQSVSPSDIHVRTTTISDIYCHAAVVEETSRGTGWKYGLHTCANNPTQSVRSLKPVRVGEYDVGKGKMEKETAETTWEKHGKSGRVQQWT